MIANRGGLLIQDELQVRAHLASLLRLEHVGMFLGAGASKAAGGQLVKELWSSFLTSYAKDAKFLQENGFVEPKAIDLSTVAVPDIEELADSIEIAEREWSRESKTHPKLPSLKLAKANLLRTLVRASLLDQYWWTNTHAVEEDTEKLGLHRQVLQRLTAARQPGQSSPWIFTTNYDLAVEWAAESIDLQIVNGFLGTHSRRFSPQSFDLGFRNTEARGEARFGVYNIYLVKLHGSLTWLEQGGQPYEEPAALAWKTIEGFLNDPEKNDLAYMVLPRAAKYLQTVGYTLGELIRRFSEFLAKAQTCLIICGYGFGDEHLNRLLRSALLNPTLQLMIFAPEYTGVDSDPTLNQFLRRLLSLKNPRVMIVGGGKDAYFDSVARYLPEPAIFDEDTRLFLKAFNESNEDMEAPPAKAEELP